MKGVEGGGGGDWRVLRGPESSANDTATALTLLLVDPTLRCVTIRSRGLGDAWHLARSFAGKMRSAGEADDVVVMAPDARSEVLGEDGPLWRASRPLILVAESPRLRNEVRQAVLLRVSSAAAGARVIVIADDDVTTPPSRFPNEMTLRIGEEDGVDASRFTVQQAIEARSRTSPSLESTIASLRDEPTFSAACGSAPVRAIAFAKVARAHAVLHDRRMIARADVDFARRVVIEVGETPPPPSRSPRESSSTRTPDRSQPKAESGDVESDDAVSSPRRRAADRRTEDRVFEPSPSAPIDFDRLIGRLVSRDEGTRGEAALSFERGAERGSDEPYLRGRRIAWMSTLRRAALRHASSGRPFRDKTASEPLVRKVDLRARSFAERRGVTFLVAIDVSGSMAQNRMREAKGIVLDLLRQAYVHRDQVAIIAVRGEAARLVLSPTGAHERARRVLAELPTGGATPMESMFALILDAARRQRSNGRRDVFALVVTDGRRNLAATSDHEESAKNLERVLRLYRAARVPTMIIDTTPVYLDRGHAAALARECGAHFLRLR